jgi:alpha-glucosidase
MYVIYESPLQMLCDTPSNYRMYPDILAFIAGVPTVWDNTRALAASAGDYLVLARQDGGDWYVGAMTDWTARSITVDLSFLAEGEYTAGVFQDGVNADRHAEDYEFRQIRVTKDDSLQIHLAPGGGWAAKLSID